MSIAIKNQNFIAQAKAVLKQQGYRPSPVTYVTDALQRAGKAINLRVDKGYGYFKVVDGANPGDRRMVQMVSVVLAYADAYPLGEVMVGGIKTSVDMPHSVLSAYEKPAAVSAEQFIREVGEGEVDTYLAGLKRPQSRRKVTGYAPGIHA